MAGDLAKAISADAIKLTLPIGEIVTLFDIEYGKTHPRNRKNTRIGKLDTWSWPFEDFAASATVDKEVANAIEGYATRNSRGGFTKQAVTITGESLNGVAGDNLIATGTVEIYEFRVIGPQGPADVTIRFAAVFDSDLAITN